MKKKNRKKRKVVEMPGAEFGQGEHFFFIVGFIEGGARTASLGKRD